MSVGRSAERCAEEWGGGRCEDAQGWLLQTLLAVLSKICAIQGLTAQADTAILQVTESRVQAHTTV
ncbi:MAG TPA: hypothetical protein VFA41_02790 [Ktedonobacteraceae bacterium]|nr:hypothetical protein [Ktedonobacteraceae bacterium]